MSSEAIPLLLATLFTVGCVAIQKTERHAELVSEMLGVLFFVAAAFTVMAVIAYASRGTGVLASSFQEQVKAGGRLPAAVE